MQFLNASSEEEFEVLKQTNVPIMNKAVNLIYDMSEDSKIREMARLREKALHDEASALANAKNEGRAEERKKLIEKWRKKGMSDEAIQELLSE